MCKVKDWRIFPRRIKEFIFYVDAQAKAKGVQIERNPLLTLALLTTCHNWTRESNCDRP